MLFALPLFVALAWWAGRGKPALTRRDWMAVVAGWASAATTWPATLDFAGLQYISASLERLILYLNPTLVLLLGAGAVYRRASARASSLALAVSYAGVLLVFGHEVSFAGEQHALGARAGVRQRGQLRGVPGLQRRGGAAAGLVAAHRAGDARVACVLCIVQFVLLRPLSARAAVAPEVIWLSLLNAAPAPSRRC